MNKIKFAQSQSKPFSLTQLILLGFLLLLVALGAMPSYLQGKWSGSQPLKVRNLSYLKNLSQTGIELPNYLAIARENFILGERKWSAQLLQQSGQEQTFLLLLMPQDYQQSLPQTEWSDLKYLDRWKNDAAKTLTVPIQDNSSQYSVEVRYFRAWNQTTFVVVQWYAWPGGGHFAPANWFWQDQWAQLRRQRLPWIAVALKIPIEPNLDPKTKLPEIRAIVQEVQTQLETQFAIAAKQKRKNLKD